MLSQLTALCMYTVEKCKPVKVHTSHIESKFEFVFALF
jgi:hypothetical protein